MDVSFKNIASCSLPAIAGTHAGCTALLSKVILDLVVWRVIRLESLDTSLPVEENLLLGSRIHLTPWDAPPHVPLDSTSKIQKPENWEAQALPADPLMCYIEILCLFHKFKQAWEIPVWTSFLELEQIPGRGLDILAGPRSACDGPFRSAVIP